MAFEPFDKFFTLFILLDETLNVGLNLLLEELAALNFVRELLNLRLSLWHPFVLFGFNPGFNLLQRLLKVLLLSGNDFFLLLQVRFIDLHEILVKFLPFDATLNRSLGKPALHKVIKLISNLYIVFEVPLSFILTFC